MTKSFEAILEEFDASDKRLAVFDREIRENQGAWYLDEPISVERILTKFSTRDEFIHDGNVIVPLHQPEDQTITGEYIIYLPGHSVKSIVYHNFTAHDQARIPIEEFSHSYPATRIRFWSELEGIVGSTESISDGTRPSIEHTKIDANQRVEVSVISDLREFLRKSREKERETARRTFEDNTNNISRVETGFLSGVRSLGFQVSDSGEKLLRVQAPASETGMNRPIQDAFGIFEGNEILLGTQTDHQEFPVEAKVVEITDRELYLDIFWDRNLPNPPEEAFDPDNRNNRFDIGFLFNSIPFDRQERAIEQIRDQEEKIALLSGSFSITFDSSTDVPIREHRLNKSQYTAAMKAVRSDDIYCIYAPPGTGKTETLVEIARALAINGQRVLVCAHSNQAVDDFLVGSSSPDFKDTSSLHGLAEEGNVTIARVGSTSSNQVVNSEYVENDPYKSDIVCGTPNSVHRFGDFFDYAILDEAGRASLTSSLIPLAKADQMILAGDHQQLPPYHSHERDSDVQLQPSLYEYLISNLGTQVYHTLRTQYRMNKEICKFPNREFYQNKLRHGERNKDWTIAGLDPLVAYDVTGEELKSQSGSYFNETEIQLALSELNNILEQGVKPKRIGIITPYKAQCARIHEALGRTFDDDLQDRATVATVDSFQGRGKDVIIISFVRSNRENKSGFLTFPEEGPRRLNVALTRAKKRCVIIGDFQTLANKGPVYDSADQGYHVFNRLFESIKQRDLLRSTDSFTST